MSPYVYFIFVWLPDYRKLRLFFSERFLREVNFERAMDKLKEFCCPAKTDEPKTVHIALGFFFIVNFCLGTGFLGVPYSFYYSGFLAGCPTLLLIAFVSWVNAIYIIECMARAQVRLLYLCIIINM